MEVDSEVLIGEVFKYPCIWDTSDMNYKDRNKKREGWKEICSSLLEGFSDKTEEDKKLIEKGLVSKWKTIRDSYTKFKRKIKCGTGSARKSLHKYIFADQLAFLDKCSTPRETETSLQENPEQGQGETEDTDEADEPTVSVNVNLENNIVEPGPTVNSTFGKKRSRKTALEDELSTYINLATKQLNKPSPSSENIEKREDDDVAFFTSLLPSVKKLDDVKKFEFRMNVMANLKSLLSPPVQQVYHIPPQSNFLLPHYPSFPPTSSQFPSTSSQFPSTSSQFPSTSSHFPHTPSQFPPNFQQFAVSPSVSGMDTRPTSSNTSASLSPGRASSPWSNHQSPNEFSPQDSLSFHDDP